MAKPKKADVVAKLEEAGIAFDPKATVDELIALLPAEASAEAAEEEESDGKDSATVYNKVGSPVRTYTKAVHGKAFKDNAKEYAAKIGGSVK